MSEGSKLSYQIEFDTDEESLVSSISTAISNTKPEIDSMLQAMITESFMESVTAAVSNIGTIKLDVDIGREITRSAREHSPVPVVDDTVGDMLKKTSSMIDEADMSSVVSSTVGILMSQIMGHLDDPAYAASVIDSPASRVMVQESMYGELSTMLGMLNRINSKFENWGDANELPRSVKEDLISIMGREAGMEVVSREIMRSSDDKIMSMTIGELMNIMGKSDIDTTEEIRQTEVMVALSKNETGGIVTVAQYDPIVEFDEQRKANDVKEFLEKEMAPLFTNIISAERAKVGEHFKLDLKRDVEFITRQYGGIVSRDVSDAEQIGGILPVPDRGTRDVPDPSASGADINKIVEGLNRVVDALYRIGEASAASDVKEVRDMMTGLREYSGSGE